MPDSIKIRVARRGDRDSIFRLLQEAGVNVAPADQSTTLSWIVSHPETEVLIAVDPLDRGVGMVSLSHRPQLRVGGRIATVDELVVTASMRHKGIGTELVERALGRAKMLGCKRVEIATLEAPTRDWFQKRGFAWEGSQVMSWKNMDAK